MLINKWLVIDSFDKKAHTEWKDGFCLELCSEPREMRELYLDLQAVENPFAIMLSAKTSWIQKASDSHIESIISLFFQPCYFLAGDKPVIFLGNEAGEQDTFIKRLSEKCLKQGLPVLIFKTKNVGSIVNPGNQVYGITSPDIDYNAIIETWLSQFLDNKDPGEIHFLFEQNNSMLSDILSTIQKKEMELHNTGHYKFATIAYQKQKLIDKYKKELDLKISAEKSTQLYLSMQKKQTADNVEWYHHEYEVLPTWYKRLGHVIKVLMGKRTFRSLFSDKVKKYKD
jgi:hypothetical protein